MNWQPITDSEPPKAPCFLGYYDATKSKMMTKFFPTLPEPMTVCTWTYFYALPGFHDDLDQPAKHPVEAAFEAWCRNNQLSPDYPTHKIIAKWAFQYAAKELCEPTLPPATLLDPLVMRERLNKAAQSL